MRCNTEPASAFATTLPAVDAPSVRFLGVRFNILPLGGVLDRILSVPPGCDFGYVVTPNVDHMVRITSHSRYAALYAGAWLCLNDSKILRLLSKMSGEAIETVPGADLVSLFLTDARLDRRTPIMIIGGSESLPVELERRFGLVQVSQHRPPMNILNDPGAIEAAVLAVEAADARFVFLAIGSPQQEILAAAIRNRGKARGLGLCVGASFDFLVGRQRRAPLWMRRMALEWCFRLLSEPRRMWRRYLVTGPQIFVIFALDVLSRSYAKTNPSTLLE